MINKLSILTLLSVSTLFANNLKPILQIGYDFGGTTLATIERDDYYMYDVDKIRSGQGLSIEIGAVVDTPNLELQFLIGYKYDQESASNGEVTWDVIPFSALALFKSKQWKVGGGVTYHLNPEIKGSFRGYNLQGKPFHDYIDDQYENALGGVAQVQYRATEDLNIGIKGTFMEYKLKEDLTTTTRGNTVGINISYSFGNEQSKFR